MSTPKDWPEDRFVPCTRAISIGGGVVYRPLRSWHSGVYAGERLKIANGDRSGCITEVAREDGSFPPRQVASPPYTYTHRVYWSSDAPERTVSAFLSYPNGMGSCDQYFWEALTDDVHRWFTEEECETAIRAHLAAQSEGVAQEVKP